MLVEVKEFIEGIGYRYFVINRDSVELIENNHKQRIEVEYKNIFNTVLGLFSLANEWENNEIDEGIYEVSFYKNNNVTKFCFNEAPSNWMLFKAYLGVLVGDSYE